MKKRASIAVLMSVYKNESPKYLELALHSVWDNQTLLPEQIILVQDGDVPKELSDVIDQWKTKLGEVLVYSKNEYNLGLTKSLIKGIQFVKTKYIARMDSDDICLPERFERQFNFLEQNHDIAVLGSNAQEIDENGSYTNVRIYPSEPSVIPNYICRATPLQHSAVMMRTSLFTEGLLSYNPRYRMTQDLALWFDVLAAGYKIANLNEVLFLFRITKDTFKRRNISKAFLEFEIYMKGIFRIKTFTWRYIFPISRLILRLMPRGIIRIVYKSRLRSNVLAVNSSKVRK